MNNKTDKNIYDRNILKKQADAGSAEAAHLLGEAYRGHIEVRPAVEESQETAIGWYKRAASLGHTDSLSKIGILYWGGDPKIRDQVEAFRWFELAAARGCAAGAYGCARALLFGEGTQKDVAEGLEHLHFAAEHGEDFAQLLLGDLYEKGELVEKDEEQAAYWYKRGAAQGFAPCQEQLGLSYWAGIGLPVDEEKGFHYLTLAAEQGLDSAMFSLAELYMYYAKGWLDPQKALHWYQLAAEQEHPAAMAQLGEYYDEGRYVAQDKKKAFELFTRAAELGHPGA